MKKQKYLKQEKNCIFFQINVLSLITYNGHYYCFGDKYYKKNVQIKKTAPFIKFL